MKTIDLEKTKLDSSINQAQNERLLLKRNGKPVALLIGVDEEQIELGRDQSFWKLIEDRRTQETLTREELESRTDSNGCQ